MSEFIIECWYDFDDGWIAGEHRDEIIRCRDCKHFERMNSDEGWCTVPDGDGGYAWWMVDDDGYCYLGIRSAGE